MKVLLIEDVESISELLVKTLASHHYIVDVVSDGQTGLEVAIQLSYDIILLDVMLPRLDGITLCRRLRVQGCQTPILMLTSKESNTDIITGLDAGADDYVAKSCDPSELLARIRALVRRSNATAPSSALTWEGLCLNPISAEVSYEGQAIALSPKEYSLLELFLRSPQRIFSRNAIINHLWSFNDAPTENAVTNLIKDLRRKLKNAGVKTDLIETVYGFGYRVRSTAAAKQAPPRCDDDTKADPELVSIHQIWERFQASLEPRIAVLENAEQALIKGNLNLEQLKNAREEAHRLAGGLGTFGYDRGSELMREIEHLLADKRPLGYQDATRLSQLMSELKQELKKPAEPPTILTEPLSSPFPKPFVIVFDNDVEFVEALARDAAPRNLQIKTMPAQSTASLQLPSTPPDAILLNLHQTKTIDDGLALLQICKHRWPEVPIITLANRDTLSDRVAVARMGAARFISKSATTAQILESLVQILPNSQPSEAKVMLVDDDLVELELLTTILQPWGIQVTALADANQFWDVLAATTPDLLLLDIEMPAFNGIELCRVVRQDATHSSLPILVVTAHTTSIQEVFAAGADDFISKPVVGPELVTRVLNRIERSRLQRQLTHLRWQQLTKEENK
jgi:DNA-binding response OmpR family regulator